jgi:hypothetical protein
MRRPAAATIIVAGLVALATASCSGDDDPEPPGSVPVNEALCLDGERASRPVVEMIDPAIASVDELYGAPQRYYEVSADTQRVSLVVAVDDGTAEQVFYCGAGGRTPPESLGEADGSTFPGDSIDIDPESIFDQLDDELDQPDIVDFATVGAGGDDVVHDATVRSDSGGILLVLLSADGEVLAVQAQ